MLDEPMVTEFIDSVPLNCIVEYVDTSCDFAPRSLSFQLAIFGARCFLIVNDTCGSNFQDTTSSLLVPTDVDAAISAIARMYSMHHKSLFFTTYPGASLRNLAFSVDLLRPFVDEAGAGGNRKLSDSDIYGNICISTSVRALFTSS